MTPIISFIIPVYNVEKYISRCLDSIYALKMELEQFEILCIDDCSQDSSVFIIENYLKNFDNIKLLRHKKNGRQGAARNTGIRNAIGNYCMFIDADDSLPVVNIIDLLLYMQQNNLELLIGKANVITQNEDYYTWGGVQMEKTSFMSGPTAFINKQILKTAFGVVWLAIYKIDLVKRIPPFHENVQYEDTDWTLRCAYEAKLLQYRPIVLYNYHNNPATTTTTKSINSLIARTKQSLRLYHWALTTSNQHNEVIITVEEYGVWNLRGLNALITFSRKDRKLFYKSFTSEELKKIANWKGSSINYTIFFVKYPILSQVILYILHPIYRIYNSIKRII